METDQLSTQQSQHQGRNKENKDFLEFNENKGTEHPNLWNTNRRVLRGKFKVLSPLNK